MEKNYPISSISPCFKTYIEDNRTIITQLFPFGEKIVKIYSFENGIEKVETYESQNNKSFIS